jgi:YVTN family beta-propeller protein
MLSHRSVIPKNTNHYYWWPVDLSRKHLFVLNFTDQTVSVIDTSTDTVESTISLPSTATEGTNWVFRCMHYRPVDDCIYLYGFQRVCKIDANPNSPTFKNVYNVAGTLNASNLLSIGGSYNYTDCAYNWANDRVYLTNNSAGGYAYWDFSFTGTSAFLTTKSQFLAQGGALYFFPPNKIVSAHSLGFGIYDENDSQDSFVIGQSAANLWGSFCYVRGTKGDGFGKYLIGTGGIGVFNEKTKLRDSVIVSTGGSSAYTQMIQSLCYAPDYGLLFGFIKQMGTGTVYVYDWTNQTSLGTFVRPNIEASAIYSGGCVYSANSKKLYLQSAGTASGVTRVHVFNPQTWINNGQVTLSDNYQGYITCGNMQDSTSPTLEHRMCMNHIIPY